jgi:hypothetical protein
MKMTEREVILRFSSFAAKATVSSMLTPTQLSHEIGVTRNIIQAFLKQHPDRAKELRRHAARVTRRYRMHRPRCVSLLMLLVHIELFGSVDNRHRLLGLQGLKMMGPDFPIVWPRRTLDDFHPDELARIVRTCEKQIHHPIPVIPCL